METFNIGDEVIFNELDKGPNWTAWYLHGGRGVIRSINYGETGHDGAIGPLLTVAVDDPALRAALLKGINLSPNVTVFASQVYKVPPIKPTLPKEFEGRIYGRKVDL